MKEHITAIEPGKGGLKYYSYWINLVRLTTKKKIREAIIAKMSVRKKDKICGTIEKYNYRTKRF